ncbi:MAG: long-chain-fatty-acid--CoA ligase [Burkholderiales bacterium]|nr:long-chain-fatty-acid--CoA ligase [Burkholderiales bacterium]
MSTRHFAHWPPGLPRELPVPETSLSYNLEAAAARYPGKPALVFYGRELSYRDLAREVEALAGFMERRLGVARGDRVLVDLQNSPQFVIAYYAALRVGAVAVPVNPMNLHDELAHFVADSGARVAIAGEELLERFVPLLGDGRLERIVAACYSEYAAPDFDLPTPEMVRAAPRAHLPEGCIAWRDAIAAALAPRAAHAGPDDLALLVYTSGTTGRPKGVMHSHRTVMATAVAIPAWFGATAGDVVLAALPFSHVTGMQGGMNAPIFSGQTVVLMSRWDRGLCGSLIERHRVTIWRAISTMLIDFLADPDAGRHDLASLRSIGGGGAAIPEAIHARLATLTGLEPVEGYGLTETMAPSHYNPPHRPKRQCLGIPIFGVDARIVDPDTLAELPRGEVGEIVIAGPQVFLGYWRDADATRAAFIEIGGKRFFRSGDLGRIDAEGYFFMADRLKRMINASGLKVWPAEVEGILHGHPDILECCVVGVRDPYRGETVKAVVVPKPDRRGRVSAEAIIAWCRGHMAAYKVPRIVAFADSLPKSGTGKVLWREVQEEQDPT